MSRKQAFLATTFLALAVLACAQLPTAGSTSPVQVNVPTAAQPSSDDLCAWFFKTQVLRSRRISGLVEFTNWSLSHDFESLTYEDALEMVAILVRYQPYQEEFVRAWQDLGPHAQAREFWVNELESVQLRIESISAMDASLGNNDQDAFNRAWELFAQSQTIGNRAESAMLEVRAHCVN